MMLFTIILLALSVSIDALGIGITYGLRKTSISTPAKFILFIVSFAFVCISVSFGYFLASLFPTNIIKIISVILLCLMGFLIIYESMNTNEKKEYKSHKIFLKPLGITIQIIRNPISSDLNNSKIIEKNESIYLAFALSLDSICVGITSSSFGIYSLLFPILVPLFQFLFLNVGIILGKKIVLYNTSIKKWNILSGILLIIIGILRVF
ncbi:MAG: sporulation membrane protein YtaF [Clostridia bacterium]